MPEGPRTPPTAAQALAGELSRRGVRRIFGIPGGGSSLDVIEAAAAEGIDFVIARTETAAAIMAGVTGELTGVPGVALGTKGPGVTNAINGLAQASLDRAPLLYLADGFSPRQAYMTHQVLDQEAAVAPVTKAAHVVSAGDDVEPIRRLLDTAVAWPRGPVYLEITSERAGAPMAAPMAGDARRNAPALPDAAALAAARDLLGGARRPVLVAGLQAVQPDAAPALRRLADALACPVFPTYKAKGVLPDDDPRVVGLYVGGAGEAPAIRDGDLVLLFGADPVEFALQPWRYDAPVLEIARHPFDRHYVTPAAGLYGDPAAIVDSLLDGLAPSTDWDAAWLAAKRADLREKLAVRGGGPVTPQHVIEAAVAAAPEARITVDAGAHMLPVMAFWDARRPLDVLISNGLATMGFALPAAIGAALAEPERPVIAFTGDGGLMMCAGELATAAQYGCNLTVVVINDQTLSLIGVKQKRRELAARGVDFAPTDFAAVARGFGLAAWRVDAPEAVRPAIADAVATPGPALVDVVVDPAGYLDQVKALRG